MPCSSKMDRKDTPCETLSLSKVIHSLFEQKDLSTIRSGMARLSCALSLSGSLGIIAGAYKAPRMHRVQGSETTAETVVLSVNADKNWGPVRR